MMRRNLEPIFTHTHSIQPTPLAVSPFCHHYTTSTRISIGRSGSCGGGGRGSVAINLTFGAGEMTMVQHTHWGSSCARQSI
jgi:hypothetical protein